VKSAFRIVKIIFARIGESKLFFYDVINLQKVEVQTNLKTSSKARISKAFIGKRVGFL
jgi:hypothetical protein